MRRLHSFPIMRTLLQSVLALAMVCPWLARAQSGVGDIVYTVGTVAQDTHGRHWAYLLWQATTPSLISNRVFAIYSKPGDATNNAPYARLSIVKVQTDPLVIEPLLRRAENLGDNLFKLQEDLLQVFANLMPSNAISRADQLSAIIRGSVNDPRTYQNLLLLARNHAGINLALGLADAEQISTGLTTFEIRAFDPLTEKDLAVIGRVTVQAGSPTILPPPGPPVVVPEASAMGDLNIKLRWGTPDGLRRLGLMQFGFNLYRVTRAYAASQGWNVANPPPISVLTNLVITQPAVAKRVNRVPITPGHQFTVAEAADLSSPGADKKSMFIMDDDGRGRAMYVNWGFTNGAQYYYYVTARDVLGRDGAISPGLLATVCDRMPPLPPTSVSVVNDYSYNPVTKTSNQALRVVWKQSVNTNDTTTNYWIYRWTSLTQMHALSGDISNKLIAVVAHQPGSTYNNHLDIGPTSPNAATDLGKTYWYTVRAGDAGACAQNLSGPGGPAYGVLRDRIGPAPGSGFIEINCLRPAVRSLGQYSLFGTNDFNNFPIYLACQRTDPRIEWVQFYCIARYTSLSSGIITYITNDFGRMFLLGNSLASTWWTPPRYPGGGQFQVALFVTCRAGFFNGRVSQDVLVAVTQPPSVEGFLYLPFEAFAQRVRTIAGDRKERDCFEHDPGGGSGGVDGTNNIGIHVIPTPGTREYRIYRRIDDGPMSLLCQGAVTNIASIIDCFENAPPANGGTMCFYFQLLDEHGNPSPMTQLGCIDTAPNAGLPTPVLAKITSTGNESSAGMNLTWFCPPYGVDRFEVRIAGLPTPPDTNGFNLSASLSFTSAPPASMVSSNFGTNLTLSFYPFITPKAGPGFGNNGAQFVVSCNVDLGKTYVVTVRARGKNNNAGEFSNMETFVWNPTNAPVQQVPWPARGLPSTNGNFLGIAFFLSTNSPFPVLRTTGVDGVGVLMGFSLMTGKEFNLGGGRALIYGDYDPHPALGTNVFGEPIFPCMLYRYQVPNANFPTVSGDVIQVSPLMERIAYAKTGVPGQSIQTIIADPFLTETTSTDNSGRYLWYWLRDTQPQISGARYKYVIVRFRSDHEIDQVIPTNEVEVP